MAGEYGPPSDDLVKLCVDMQKELKRVPTKWEVVAFIDAEPLLRTRILISIWWDSEFPSGVADDAYWRHANDAQRNA